MQNRVGESLWAQCQESLRSELGDTAFYCWIEPLAFEGVDNGAMVLGVPSEFVRNWLEKHYMGLLLKNVQILDPAVETVCLRTLQVGAQAAPVLDSSAMETPRNPASGTPRAVASVAPRRFSPEPIKPAASVRKSAKAKEHSLSDGFYAHYRFENYVEGECNRLALTVSRTVAQNPGANQANPLVLYGGTGLGKTHLLQSIGHYAIEHETAHCVVYRTAERFLKEYMQALKTQDFRTFNAVYDNADILLIDDIQILAGKKTTQDELFKVLSRLLSQRKQIVLCCDQLPSQVKGLNARLVERFASGMYCALDVPDLQTRIAILGRKAADLRIPPDQSDEILRWLASHHGSNVRELEGVIVKLLAFHDLLGYELDLGTVRQLLGEVVHVDPNCVSIRAIVEATAYVFGVKPELLASSSRVKQLSVPRKVAIYLSRELTDNSLQTIGLHFNRDYSTVIASLQNTGKLLESDLVVQARVGEIRRMLGTALV